ncbi:MAG: D-2-hydroxyacid dehydrogenase [Muribaculaceae bacterium]|nr:D-2-hydroxyacid dehydrogenase [Muribaculaceae bacterium]
MKIVVLDGWTGNPGDLSWEPLERLGDCTIYDRTSPDEVIERAREAEVVLTNKVTFTRETIAQLPRLRYIGVIATGYNIVDVDAARERGVIVTNVPAYSTNSVAQIVFAHLLNITTHADHYSRSVRSGRWSECRDFSYTDRPITEIAGKTIGIVGLGSIGMAVARIALAMEMKVLAHTSKSTEALPVGIEKAKDLDEVFIRGDVVSLHCPLTAETRGMVDARRLSLMKRTAILINTARGPLVDETELAAALRNGRIAAAAVDVMSQEPPERDNPLLKAPHCYFTPHIGWASVEARHRLMDIVVENVARYIAGEPVNVVN